MRLGKLERRLTIRRSTLSGVRDALNVPVRIWANYATFWAQQISQRPTESWKAGQTAAQSEVVFRVRWNSRTATITPLDRMVCESKEYEIIGVTEPVRRVFINIIGITSTDK